MNIFSLKHRNAVISGDFFPTNEVTLINKLIHSQINIMSQISAETDILICGKFPDWSLVQEARLRAINVVFIDKTSDLFTTLSPAEQNEQTCIFQVPLGI